ncbi:hypothetical protein BsWGS_04843 [Bradybaena similaris]
MDFESSSKFISSLAKFLQSLCNGYVEFNNGVEVIGHIYLNVDTGKKIDYILNEKVCKTDENSVTFISNSFHAQPAEKPKPPAKGGHDRTPSGQISDPIKTADDDVKTDEDIIIMEEAESPNIGTVASAPRDNFQHVNTSSLSKPSRTLKRPFSLSFSSSHRHSVKQSRPEPSSGSNGAPLDADLLHSENSSSNFLPPQLTGDGTITAATESDMSHLSKVFPQTFNNPVNSLGATEDRDVKPQLDNDLKVIHVKQEYDQSGHGGEDDSEIFDDSQDHSNAFPSMPYDQYYGEGSKRGQRSDYSQVGNMVQGEFFPAGVGPSLDTSGGDSSDAWRYKFQCEICLKRLRSSWELRDHKNSVHFKVLAFSCDTCGKKFAYKRSLKRHAATTCGVMRPFPKEEQ